MKVKLYTCLSYDSALGKWVKSSYRYTLDEIAGFAQSKPIMDDWIEGERVPPEEFGRNSTGSLLRGQSWTGPQNSGEGNG